jgi:hypothetical protein
MRRLHVGGSDFPDAQMLSPATMMIKPAVLS